jgi:lysyl oxidase
VLIRLLPALLAAVLLGLVAHALSSHASQGVPLLPDLDQEAPSNLVVSITGPRRAPEYVLGFRSAVRNVGNGPLIIEGHRPDREADTMVADQQIAARGGPAAVVRGVGRLRYVVSPDHRHWHLLGFERYELRTADGRTIRARDRKTGFCLGDRYRAADPAPAARPSAPVYTSRCGIGEPARLGIGEGISVGYGDDYQANLEGQYLSLRGLRNGRYLLVHRVDADRRLHDLDRGNDAASLLLGLRWRRGVPYVRVLAVCPDTANCAA